MMSNGPPRNTFLAQLGTIDVRSSEFTETLAKILSSQEDVNTAISLGGDDALTFVGILDRALESPDMDLGLRTKFFRILRKVCGSQAILPPSSILSNSITKEGDIALTCGGFTDIWEGRHNGNRVCIKAFRVLTAENLFKIKQHLFQEILIWKRLTHPNVLPVLGVSPKLFPLCIITERMINGNIMDFISKHPGVNRLHLLAEVASGLQYLHSMDIIHSNLKPKNILIDPDFHPRLTDYGLVAIISDPNIVDPVSTASPSTGTARYMAPELLNPPGFGLEDSIPTKKSDIYAFGMVAYRITAGQQPFPMIKDSMVICKVVAEERPGRPLAPNEWVSDNVWDLISGCWSSSLDSRPDAKFATDTLITAAYAVEVRRGTQPEPWEADLSDFLRRSETWDRGNDLEKAQEFADRLNEALDNVDLHGKKHGRYLKCLRKLCGFFGVLPSSFVLPPTSVEREATPFATGGFSNVYRATLNGSLVVTKILKVTDQTDQEKLYTLLVKEVVGWKWLRHNNILPFLGVSLEPPLLSIISDRMDNGTIMDFIKLHPDFNRLHLLVGAVTGLKYLHDHGIIHGDLKGANILVDSKNCARLADFGLAVAIDESITGSAAANRATRGTVRWMAPELLDPDTFGFTGDFLKELPSVSTDTYAVGMTILEVLTGRPPFENYPSYYTVILKVVTGSRPKKPPSWFSDVLWKLMKESWVEEYARRSRRRPPISTILDCLRENADHWEKSQSLAGSDGTTARVWYNGKWFDDAIGRVEMKYRTT